MQRFRESAGPYDISVALIQSGLSLGKTLFAVTVVEAASSNPVPGATVLLRIRHEGSGKRSKATAHNTPNAPERYDAQIDLDAPGTWHVSVEVDSSLGKVAAEFVQLEVPATRKITGGTFVFIGVFAVILAGAGYLWWSTRRDRRRRSHNGNQSSGQVSA